MKASFPPSFHAPLYGTAPPGSMTQIAGCENRTISCTITTREGDTVSFSAAEARAGRLLVSGNDSFTAQQLQASSLQFTVQGDLSARELRDIADLVGSLTDIGQAFFAGDLAAAFENATRLDLGDSLSTVGADFHRSASRRIRQSHPLFAQCPLPNLPEYQSQPGPGEKATKDAFDKLRATWQQITEFLDSHAANKRNPAAKPIGSIAELIEAVRTRATTALTEHPGLSPFLPALAERSIRQAGGDHPAAGPVAERVAAALNQWLLAV